MEEESEYFKYIGKKVRLLLFNNFTYTGTIIDVSRSAVKIRDKFNSLVEISPKSIMVIEEVSF